MQPQGDDAPPDGVSAAEGELTRATSKPSRRADGPLPADAPAVRQARLRHLQQPDQERQVEPDRRSLERAGLVDRPSVTGANSRFSSPSTPISRQSVGKTQATSRVPGDPMDGVGATTCTSLREARKGAQTRPARGV